VETTGKGGSADPGMASIMHSATAAAQAGRFMECFRYRPGVCGEETRSSHALAAGAIGGSITRMGWRLKLRVFQCRLLVGRTTSDSGNKREARQIRSFKMKIITYSDLHLEFGSGWTLPPEAHGDVLILAGDIITRGDYDPLDQLCRSGTSPSST